MPPPPPPGCRAPSNCATASGADATPDRRLRVSGWILVPAVLAALTGIVLILFAALAAVATGGLVALRSAVVEQGARLRERFIRLLGR